MHGRMAVETKHELLLRHGAYQRHKNKVAELMNDRLETFHKSHQMAEEQLKRSNDQKSRTFFFNKNGKYQDIIQPAKRTVIDRVTDC